MENERIVNSKSLPALSESDIYRFWSKVGFTANKEKCWIWNGSKRRRGYGRLSVTIESGKDVSVISTRIAYYLHNKIDPIGKAVLHTCDNPSCCNPSHLFLGTNKDNTQDMIRKNRGVDNSGINHGKAILTEEDVRYIKNNYKRGNGAILAKKFGVYQSVISRIINKKAWSHVI